MPVAGREPAKGAKTPGSGLIRTVPREEASTSSDKGRRRGTARARRETEAGTGGNPGNADAA